MAECPARHAMGLISSLAVVMIIWIQLTAAECPTSRGCFPSVGNIAFGRTAFANSTCGDPAKAFQTPGTGIDLIDICNASHAAKSHPANLVNDNNTATWWQAEEYTFFVTVQLNFSFPMRLEKSTLTFRSFRPNRMILEKSSDYGLTWTAYQYYSPVCLVFLIPDGLFQGLNESNRKSLRSDSTEAFCLAEDSIPNNPDQFGTVEFRAAERFGDNRFDNQMIINHLVVTNLRARFRDLSTLGDDFLINNSPPEILRKYFYAVTEWVVEGHCYCSGHAERCIQQGGESTVMGKILSGCDCQHNTQGDYCNECLPLYNNKAYQKGNSTHPNKCELCECHQHSQSCVYDSDKGYGVCQNCTDNTEGDMCEKCTTNFYLDPTKDFDDPGSCIECNCSVIGSLSMECNSRGACMCKANVEGTKCNVCKPGFFNLQADDPRGCQACTCNVAGTGLGGNSSCDRRDGVCQCKANVAGHLCDVCKPEYYNLDINNPDGCSPCACSLSTAFSLECNVYTGQCSCQQGLTGRTCNETVPGQYVPYLEGIVYEAETAQLHGAATVAESVDVVPTFTGTGFARLYNAGDRVVWWVSIPPRTINYTIIIRYKANDVVENVVVNVTGGLTGKSYSCPGSTAVISGTVVIYETSSWPSATPGNGIARFDRCHMGNRRVRVEVTYQPIGMPTEWFIDSLILMPNRVHVLPFSELSESSTEQQETSKCYTSRELVSSYLSSLSTPCPEHTFLANAWLFNGTLDCDCHEGSMSTICQPLGGDCPCESNAIGRSCSHCAYNHYNLTSSGCEACSCSPLGSVARPCETITGQCTCQPFTTGLKCDFCIENYFNVSNCEDCACDSDYSQSHQCDSEGVCQCKTGVAGAKCNEGCRSAFYDLTATGCVPCHCDPVGRLSDVCDNTTGQCPCRSGASGVNCDICRDGFFDFRKENDDACISCFCYNHSKQCTSALGYGLNETRSDFSDGTDNGWKGVTSSGSIVSVTPTAELIDNRQLIFVLQGFTFNSFAYFDAPSSFLGNKRFSYGQTLSFNLRLALLNSRVTLMSMVDGDVVIKGFSLRTSISAALPHLPSGNFQKFTIQLVESNFHWGNLNGRQVTVREMFDTLLDIEYLWIRGDFGQGSGSLINPQIYNVILGDAVSEGMTQLLNVENCTCPEGHMGLSCEHCEPGYKREVVGGNVYDSCVPCECNDHSSLCNISTGVCYDCHDNTEGNNCEECSYGYYGDATHGTATDCQKCPCPHTDGANQFSPSCFLASDGLVTCENCSIGHTGRQCEECDDGYYGQPDTPGSSCQVCMCSGNINLSDTGNCNTTTGECLKCLNNTGGFSCETCSDGFFGDALADHCQRCDCNLSGSVNNVCDKVTGQCQCLPGVTGPKCDKCLPLHFGYGSGTGCSPCDCNALGAQTSICNVSTGQCHCKPGIDNKDRRCGTCLAGFYNLTSTGCQACHCNTSNTLGGSGVCHNVTGQCKCLDGVIGRTCTACTPGFFGSPPDCIGCGECYNNWTRVIDDLAIRIETEDKNIFDVLQEHYGSFTRQQLQFNLTALQILLDNISNFSTSTASLSTAVSQLSHNLDAVAVELESRERIRNLIISLLQQTEERLNRTGSFKGTVMVESGVYRTAEEINLKALQLNSSAESSLSTVETKLNDCDSAYVSILSDKDRSDEALLLVKQSVRIVEHAQNDTHAVNAVEADFDYLYQNNSKQFDDLRANRDSLSANLALYLERAQNSTDQTTAANVTAGMAYKLAHASMTATSREKRDVDDLDVDATALLTEAKAVYNNAMAVKAEAARVNLTASQTLSDLYTLRDNLAITNVTLYEANRTSVDVLGLSLPPLSQIENISLQINESIVPEEEVNATIGQSRQSKMQALEAAQVAEQAQNVSQKAAEFVADIEQGLAEASVSGMEAQQAIDRTEFVVTAVQTSLEKVQNDTGEAINSAKQATNVANNAITTLEEVESCRTKSLVALQNAEQAGLRNCQTTGPSVLQNATRTLALAQALNGNSSATDAAADLVTVRNLRQQAMDIDDESRNTTQVDLLKGLLSQYAQLRVSVEDQQKELNGLVQELDDLLGRIETQCNTACNCSVAGSLDLQCNATGHCDCKANVDGMQCDQCSDGFFNLSAGNGEGCEACLCNSVGSVNESCTDSGDCFCNPGVIGQKCNQCAGDFFLNSTSGTCSACRCSESTATSLKCDSTGQCPCKSGLTGRICDTIEDFHWLPFLEGIVYEAEDAILGGGASIEKLCSNPNLFTGTGGVRLTDTGNNITFLVRVPQRDIRYELTFRYQASDSFDKILVVVNGSGVFEGTLPPAPDSDNAFTVELMNLVPGSDLTVTLTYDNDSPSNDPNGFFVDSLLLIPVLDDLPEYQVLTPLINQLIVQGSCYTPRQNVPTLSDTVTIGLCEEFTILASAALFNGTLDCGCANGTVNCSGVCAKLGGQCPCAPNVVTRTCSACDCTFFGVDCDGCEACGCNPNGTTAASLGSCDDSGQCVCQPNVTGLKCDTRICEDGFFSVAGGLSACVPCGCSLSTADSTVCNKTSGQCPCKSGLTGRICDTIEDFHWLPFLEGIVYEAEDAILGGGASIEKLCSNPNLFTGTGGVRLTDTGNNITFLVRVPQRDIRYELTFRYQASDSFDKILVVVNGSGVFEGTLPPAPDSDNAFTVELMNLVPGSDLTVTLTYDNDSPSNDPNGFFVDSLLLIPVLDDLPEYQVLTPLINQLIVQGSCYTPRQNVPTLSDTGLCEEFTILASAALFNGTLDCGCANGTVNCSGVCAKLGGQCPCAPNVVTRTCSACDCTFFGVDCDGCEACMCNDTGSLSSQCNETGFCDCRPNVDGQKCSMCRTGFFNFSSSNPDVCEDCNCHPDFSVSPQCDDLGVCSCKPGVGGDRCDVCLDEFFGLSTSGCTACNCSAVGSNSTVCNKTDGQCECLVGVIGRACDQCDVGFFGLGFHGDGCMMCNCSGHSTDCTLATSMVSDSQENCTCLVEFQGFSCEKCSSGFKRQIPGGDATVDCVPCQCNNHSVMCDASTGVCINCTGNTEGDFCGNCTDEFFGHPLTEDCMPCGCDPVGASTPICDKSTGVCSCNARFGGPDDRSCSLCKDEFFNKTAGCVMCECNVTQTINGSNICDRETGQCPCETEFRGMTCNECAKGFQGVVPNCVSCGDCFYNWTMLIEELVTKTNNEYQRIQDIIEQHYGPLTIEQLTNNVTALRNFLTMIVDSLDANTTAIAEKLATLKVKLSDMNVNSTLDMLTEFYENVKATLDHVEAILSSTSAFNGTVKLPNGKYISNESLIDLAIQLNDSANEALESSAARLSEVETNKSRVNDAKVRADAAQMTVDEAVNTADRAANYTAATRALEIEFRELYENNTKKLMSLVVERDAISDGLTMYLEEAKNATKAAIDANDTASDALALAQQKLVDATNDKATADEINANAGVALDAACQVYNDTSDAKEKAVNANNTATLVLNKIGAAETRLVDQNEVLHGIRNTTDKTLALALPPLDEITDLSRQINETIIPERIVNETIDHANEAYTRAMEVDEASRKALNISKQAAELVNDIEAYIAAAEGNQTAAEGKINETKVVVAEVHVIKADIENTNSQTHAIAQESREIAGQALTTVDMVETCRNEAIDDLETANETAAIACNITGPEILMNASRVHDKALALNASEAVEKAAGDLVVAEGLLSESQSLQKNVTDPYLVHALMELLDDYAGQKQNLIKKKMRLEDLDQELSVLEGQLDNLCDSY